jgi:hypothetical protein
MRKDVLGINVPQEDYVEPPRINILKGKIAFHEREMEDLIQQRYDVIIEIEKCEELALAELARLNCSLRQVCSRLKQAEDSIKEDYSTLKKESENL